LKDEDYTCDIGSLQQELQMSMIAFINTVLRFVRDQSARLAPVPIRHDRTWKKRRAEQERHDASLGLVLLVAAIYVVVRIGLSYGIVGRF
jgi:hypothetical protein